MIYGTSLEIQLVYLHEVKSAMNANFQTLILISIGAGLLSVPVPFVTVTLWPVGLALIIFGAWSYRKFVQSTYKNWESRRVPLANIPTGVGQIFNQSDQVNLQSSQ